MDKTPLYSIGHGNRSAEELLELLQVYEIKYRVDVRSAPYSKYNPHFNKKALEAFLKGNGITYVFMGDTLGGRPEDRTCYTDDKVDYEKIKTKEFYKEGIGRLKTAYEKEIPLAMMCSESKPQDCHRSKLIGETLTENKIPLAHIDEKGALKSQADVMLIVTKGRNTIDLFGQSTALTSRKKYKEDEED